jgi:AP2-associated kinase
MQRPSPEEVVDAGDTTRLRRSSRPVRPSLSRKHRSSIAIKQTHHSGHDVFGSPVQTSPVVVRSPHVSEPKDWLTGDDDGTTVVPVKSQSTPAETPVLREFTSKHSSIIQSNSSELQSSQEAVTSEQLPSPPSSSPIKPKHTMPKASRPVPFADMRGAQKDVPGRLIDNGGLARGNGMQQIDKVSSSSDEGPEDVNGFTPPKSPKRKESKKRKGRQSSVHDLVDLWGGGVIHLKEKDKQREKEVAQNPAIGDYKSRDSDEHAKSPARRSTFLPSSSSNPRSASPQPIPPSPTKPARSNRPHRSPSHHRKQTSHVAKPNASHPQSPSGRMRPSSMLVFPVTNSKSDSSATLPSPAVSPAEELIQRRTRRTSISDMVQRYEAIGSSKGSRPVSPITVQKPTPLKVATPTTASINVRTPRLSHGSSPIVSRSNARAGSVLPVLDDEPVGASIHARTRTSPTGLARASTLGHRDSIWTREVENPNFARPRRSSPEKSSVISSANEFTISDQQNPQSSFPTQRPTTPPQAEDSPQRSPSPEKPYQGVGKLIDQWQRKTGDIEPVLNSSPRRGGFAAKRALPGLVGGGTGRGR